MVTDNIRLIPITLAILVLLLLCQGALGENTTPSVPDATAANESSDKTDSPCESCGNLTQALPYEPQEEPPGQEETANVTSGKSDAPCESCGNLTQALPYESPKDLTDEEEALKIAEIQTYIKENDLDWVAGPTSVSKLSPEAYARLLGRKTMTPESGVEYKTAPMDAPAVGLPASFDWRDNQGDWTTPVRDQGGCGSCWAFAITGVFESYWERLNNDPGLNPNFAEQYLVSCAEDMWGCGGGNNYAMEYLVNTPSSMGGVGTSTESVYPYTATTGTCRDLGSAPRYKVPTGEDWYYVWTGSNPDNTIPGVEQLKTAIYTKGPLTAYIYADSSFSAYSGGFMESPSTYDSTNHAIVMIGWGRNPANNREYWICKNSWGTNWGEDGWFNIYTDELRIGEGAAYFSLPDDLTPPAPVTSLLNTTYTSSSITWNWIDPADADFSQVMVYRNGIYLTSVAKGVQSYTATGLSPQTSYTLGTRTVDMSGNINPSWTNHTAMTAPGSGQALTLTNALDAPELVWTLGGNAQWYPQTDITYFDGDAGRSGAITDLQQSSVTTTVAGPGTLTFWWKVSSQQGKDFLRFFINGFEQTKISGNADWQQRTYTLGAGTQTLRWRYTKDFSTSQGSDCGWLDQVVFSGSGDTTPPAPVTNLRNTTYNPSSITWSWTDPADADFNRVMVYRNGVFVTNVTRGTQSYTATGLSAQTSYTLSTRTVDTIGNINQAWVNNTTLTAPSTGPLTLGDALEASGFTWTTGGNGIWFPQTATSYYDGDAAQSGVIGNSQQCSVMTTVTGPGTLSFWWKVSSETDRDYLRFLINGALQTKISGETGWQYRSYVLGPGQYEVKWRYTKDISISQGSDCGWLDRVSMSS